MQSARQRKVHKGIKMKKYIKTIFVICSLAITVLACGLPAAATPPVIVLPPTLPPLVEPVELKSTPFSEESQVPVYKITAQIHPSVQAFNAYVKSVVEAEISAFKGGMAEMPETPISAGSSFDIQYALIGQKGSVWSIQFNIMGYSDGAAHPYTYSITVNYDLQNIKPLTMDDVFLPGSNYLQVLSDISKTELTNRNMGYDPAVSPGAEPTPQNYRNWNVSNEGFFVITFDQGQVGPYAAGPQVITIPFSALTAVINAQGPLAPYLP
jgi:hypothetical protein